MIDGQCNKSLLILSILELCRFLISIYQFYIQKIKISKFEAMALK